MPLGASLQPPSAESMTTYEKLTTELKAYPKRWLVTGCAGFIGSNLIEALLKLDQHVVGLDNYATGYLHNIEEVKSLVSEKQWLRFQMVEGDIVDLDACHSSVAGVDYVLHQAALGSVPRSIADPIASNEANVSGFLNMLVASRDAKVPRFVYASSSAVYGDHEALPKCEEILGNPLSPYAVTKLVNELYTEQFATHYGLECRGLRYFNVFGPRQDPEGAYAAVIPRWIDSMIKGDQVEIYGDGETSRDFCYISNVVQANLLAATQSSPGSNAHDAFNIAVGGQTSLNELYAALRTELGRVSHDLDIADPAYADFRLGDVRHSLANIDRAKQVFGYEPTHSFKDGLVEAMQWYVDKQLRQNKN